MAVTVSSKDETQSTASVVERVSALQAEEPSEEDIRILAYRLYERRQEGGIDGDAASDWIEAERQLREDE